MPIGYHALMVPTWLRKGITELSPLVRAELERVGNACPDAARHSDLAVRLINRILPTTTKEAEQSGRLEDLLHENGFDPVAHEQLREDLKSGRLGLSQNRLDSNVKIEDVAANDILDARRNIPADVVELGRSALSRGEVGVITLAAGVGSRWTQGAGVVKALNPFCRMEGEYRSFLDIHFAKTTRSVTCEINGIAISRQAGLFFSCSGINGTTYISHLCPAAINHF